MGHRAFTQPICKSNPDKQSSKSAYFRAPYPTARNYLEEMAPVNGMVELTEEQLAEAQAERERFRDDVSKKMGELLLRGVTMLDAYCEVCNGILMEDRNGVRTCVTCELFAERTREGSRLISEVPLDVTADGVTPGNSLLSSEEQQPSGNIVRVMDIERKQWAGEDTTSRKAAPSFSKESVPSAPLAHPAPVSDVRTRVINEALDHAFPGCTAALLAIDRKLQWASEKIARSENPSEIRELFALVKEGLSIIKSMKSDTEWLKNI